MFLHHISSRGVLVAVAFLTLIVVIVVLVGVPGSDLASSSSSSESDRDPVLFRWTEKWQTLPMKIDGASRRDFFGKEAAANTARNSPTATRLVVLSDFSLDWYDRIVSKTFKTEKIINRKWWEFSVIHRAVEHSVDFKKKGADVRGFGFGVGIEPLGPAFVAAGATKIVVSDMPPADNKEWGPDQHAAAIEGTMNTAICPKDVYLKAASFMHVNMLRLPADLLQGGYDFVWSCSSLEHTGTIERSLTFLKDTIKMLKPGGVSVHTTEFIVSSAHHTVEIPNTFTMLRKKDIERLAVEVEGLGAKLTRRDYFAGGEHEDSRCDEARRTPYHFKLYRPMERSSESGWFSTPVRESCHTSIIIVIQKNV